MYSTRYCVFPLGHSEKVRILVSEDFLDALWQGQVSFLAVFEG